MKFRNTFFLSLFFIAGCFSTLPAIETYNTTPTTLTAPSDNIIVYTVKKGDTVYSIAAAHNTTVEAIYKLNPKAERGIKDGDSLQIPIPREATGFSNHLIEAKETLFSVARMYSVSEDEVKKANPGLSETTFSKGKTIKIPKFSSAAGNNASYTNEISGAYRVRKSETLYSIGKAHNVSVEALLNANPNLKQGGLKEGTYIIIPAVSSPRPSTTPVATTPVETVAVTETPYAPKGETVKVGILFPFLDNKGTVNKDKLVEYYEGFLLAVKDLKSKGLNAEIYTFDIGAEKNSKKLQSLLGTNELKNLHLIIGGVSDQQIDALTKFSKETGIKYVIPFGSVKAATSSPTIFQMTSSHSALYPEITDAFIKKYGGYNIIFVSEVGSNRDKLDFTDALKRKLTELSLESKSVNYSSNLVADIKAVASTSGKNVLIPLSSSEATLKKIIAAANSLDMDNITLFGYPEWQIYGQQAENLHKYEACLYSIFFLNEKQSSAQKFAEDYKKWYNKKLINSFPKYGYLGYDTGLYFLTVLNRFGSDFAPEATEFHVPTLQSAVSFNQLDGKGAFINKGVYFVNYKKNSDIEKNDIGKTK